MGEQLQRVSEARTAAQAALRRGGPPSAPPLDNVPSALLAAAGASLGGGLPADPHTEVTAAQVDVALLERDIAQRSPGAWRHLKPFLYQNALWLAGGLLILFGSLYFLRTLWDLSSLLWYAAVTVALHGYAGAFFAVGYLLARKREAHAVGRILYAFTLVLLPLASVATGELVALLLRAGPGGVALALLSLALALAAQGVLLALIAGLYERASIRPLVGPTLALALATMTIAPAFALSSRALLHRWSPLLIIVGLGCFTVGLRGLEVHRVRLRMTLLTVVAALLWAFVTSVVRLHVAAPLPATHYAPLLSLVALLLLHRDERLLRRADAPPRLGGLRQGLYGLLALGPMLALLGLVQRGYFDTAARVVVLLAALPALIGYGRAAKRHGRHLLTFLAATIGLLCYFFLPAPFSGALVWFQGTMREVLGYRDAPLPLAYYGLTFLPYLAACLALAARWRRRHSALATDLQRFVFALALLLLPLASSAAPDLRPMLWTWPCYALMALFAAQLFDRPALRLLAQGLILLWIVVLGAGLWQRYELPVAAPLVAAYALSCAVAAFYLGTRAKSFAQLGALGGAFLVLPLATFGPWPLPPTLQLVLSLAGGGVVLLLVAAQRRSRGLSLLVPFAVVLTLGALLDCQRASASLASLVFLVVAAAAAQLVQRLEPRRESWWHLLLVQPLLLMSLLASLASLGLLSFAPRLQLLLGSLLVVLIALQLVLQVAEPSSTLAVGLLLTIASGLLGYAIHPHGAAPAVVVAGALLLLIGQLLSPLAVAAEVRRRGLLWLGHLVALLALTASLALVAREAALDVMLALGAGAILAAGLTVVHLRRWLAEASAVLIVFALLTAGLAFDLSRATVALMLGVLALLASEVVRRFGCHDRSDPWYRLLAAPAATALGLAVAGMALLGLERWPVGAPLAAALLALHLALAQRSAWTASYGVIAVAGMVAQLAFRWRGDAWSGALALVAPLLLLGAQRVFRGASDERRRRIAASLAASAVALVALCWALSSALVASSGSWVLQGAGGALLFAAVASALLPSPFAAFALSVVAVAGWASLAALLEIFVPRTSLAQHLLVLASVGPSWLLLGARLRGGGRAAPRTSPSWRRSSPRYRWLCSLR